MRGEGGHSIFMFLSDYLVLTKIYPSFTKLPQIKVKCISVLWVFDNHLEYWSGQIASLEIT